MLERNRAAKRVPAPAPTVVDALVVLRVDASAQLRPRARLHGCKRGRVCAEAHQGWLCLKLHLQHITAEEAALPLYQHPRVEGR